MLMPGESSLLALIPRCKPWEEMWILRLDVTYASCSAMCLKAGMFGDAVHYGQHWMYFFFVCGMAY